MEDREDLMLDILEEARSIAVVGISHKPERDSNMVARYMQHHGYHILPVRPGGGIILGEKVFEALADIDEPIDIVDVFRAADQALGVVEECIKLDPKPIAIWLQFGVVNEAARDLAEKNGIHVFMDQCLKIDHARLLG